MPKPAHPSPWQNRPPAGDVARMLAARVQELCLELLPDGRREGGEWVSKSRRGTSPRALSVRQVGGKAGVFGEFDSGAKGDALDLVAHVLFAGDKKKAYAWALNWLGIAQGATPAPMAQAPAPRAAAAEDPDAIERRRAAQAMWLAAEASIAGTPVSAYLRGRGIDLAQLGRQPRSLRYAPALYNRETGRKLPAMVAAIVAPDGAHLATHRAWLAPDAAGVWRKAALRNPKMTLGGFAGGTIRLWRGASSKPLAAAPESDTVVIAEGIETGLSVAVACPELRVLCAVSLGNLARLALPPNVLDIIVAADNDAGNPAAERLLDHAVSRLLAEGRSVRIARSSVGSDFNDALQGVAA